MVNYIEHYSKIINPSSFLSKYAVIISIFLFLIGQIIILLRGRRNKVHELELRKLFVKEWVEGSKETLDNYIKSLEELSKSITKNNGLNAVGWKYNIIHFSKVNDISLKEYFETFNYYLKRHNQNSRKLFDFLFKLNHIDKIHPIIMEIYKEYCNNNYEIFNEWNLNYMKLANLFIYTNYNEITEEVKPIIRETSDLFFKCSDDKKDDLSMWRENFIKPILNKLDDGNYKQYPIMNEISLLTSNLYIVTTKHNNIKNYSRKFEHFAKDLTESEKIMSDSMNYFDDKKFKNPWNLFNNL